MGKAKEKAADLNELKQEVKMDEHIIPLEELAARYNSNIETVGFVAFLKLQNLFYKKSLYMDNGEYS
ncbi:unnamed protein product [Cylicostephanus goldi]|uniref:Uncharacterized protein n=1 Tax=Cylicostephanus goldi TaxID=71465 RepID=A0A3P6SJV1_CYLGO|nr:unnamed protein product [Cylicostephanus goldi]